MEIVVIVSHKGYWSFIHFHPLFYEGPGCICEGQAFETTLLIHTCLQNFEYGKEWSNICRASFAEISSQKQNVKDG